MYIVLFIFANCDLLQWKNKKEQNLLFTKFSNEANEFLEKPIKSLSTMNSLEVSENIF